MEFSHHFGAGRRGSDLKCGAQVPTSKLYFGIELADCEAGSMPQKPRSRGGRCNSTADEGGPHQGSPRHTNLIKKSKKEENSSPKHIHIIYVIFLILCHILFIRSVFSEVFWETFTILMGRTPPRWRVKRSPPPS